MESSDQYNFSLFYPRNKHGRKNRNVILVMLVIWATAVFGFQILLRVIQRPVPEKALTVFESAWPSVSKDQIATSDYKAFLNSLLMVKGKNIVPAGEQKLLDEAISCLTFNVVSDSVKKLMLEGITELKALKLRIAEVRDQEYLDAIARIREVEKIITDYSTPYTGIEHGSLESVIFSSSLLAKFPLSFTDDAFSTLPQIMKLYLTHNQSVLTDTKFLGFPFHYFYTAVFLLILFVSLCITYNLLVEWRLKKEGVVE